MVGGEYELFSDARLGVTYTHRYLNRALEDMSRDEANTYFIGNPGYGIASDFPKAVRNYDAITVYFDKAYANTWLFKASYTLSRLYGNYAGPSHSEPWTSGSAGRCRTSSCISSFRRKISKRPMRPR